MRLVRFLARAFHDGGLVEAGEERLVSDETVLGAHMLDVQTGQTGPVPAALMGVHRYDLAPHAGMPIADVPGPRTVAAVPDETLDQKVERLEEAAKAAYLDAQAAHDRWQAAVQERDAAQAPVEEPAADEPVAKPLTPEELAAIQADADKAVEAQKTEQAPEIPAPPG